MPFTVLGAGAIGGTVGAYLARAGEDVTFVDADPQHVAAMQAAGLTIRGFAETFTVHAPALHPSELHGPLHMVLLAVKAQHTEAAVRSVLPLLTEASVIVSLQNGLCERTIASLAGPQRTLGAFVNFSADYLEPGVIHYGSAGAFYVGELDGRSTPRLAAIVQALRHWGHVLPTANIYGYLWAKLGYANMLFATATVDDTMASAVDRHRPLMVELAAEIYEVAEREGVRPEPFDAIRPALYYPRQQPWAEINRSLDEMVRWMRGSQKTKSGIWRDLAVRKRKTEVDAQIGLAAEIGAQHGLAMPLTRRLVRMIHELEEGTRTMSWSNLAELEALRARTSGARQT